MRDTEIADFQIIPRNPPAANNKGYIVKSEIA
jgi:hypothetical protein